jgi:hypothetical protein
MTTLITFNRDDSPVTENFLSYYNRFVDRIEIWDISSDSNAIKFVGTDKVKVVALAEGYKNENGFIQLMSTEWKIIRNENDIMIVVEPDEYIHSRNYDAIIRLNKDNHSLIEPTGFQVYVDRDFDFNFDDKEIYGKVDGNYTKPVIVFVKNLLKLKFTPQFKLIDSIKSLNGQKALRNTSSPLSFPVKLLKVRYNDELTEEEKNKKIRII